MEKLHVLKIGGQVIDDPVSSYRFLKNFSSLPGKKILVHGGGKLATDLATKLGIPQQLVDGRRVTTAETLDLTIMVYAGLINKNLVAGLQALHCKAFGLCGADGNLISATKRKHLDIDFGFVGDVDPTNVNTKLLKDLFDLDLTPVVSPITHDGNGILLNTNADNIARILAVALKDHFDVTLTYCFEKKGVLSNIADAESIITQLSRKNYEELKSVGIISKGMLPKLENAFKAMDQGIDKLILCHANAINTKEAVVGTRLVRA